MIEFHREPGSVNLSTKPSLSTPGGCAIRAAPGLRSNEEAREPERGEIRMTEKLSLSRIRFTAAPPHLADRGLIGFISAVVNDSLELDGLALRRTLGDGRITLSFPARRDRSGQQRAYFRPVGDDVRREIERQILRALGLEEEVRAPSERRT